MRRRRWRTAVLWGGCVMCVLIAGAFVASGFFLVGMNFDERGPIVAVVEGAGFIEWRDFSNVAFFATPLSLLPRERRPSWALWNAWSILRPDSEIFVMTFSEMSRHVTVSLTAVCDSKMSPLETTCQPMTILYGGITAA